MEVAAARLPLLQPGLRRFYQVCSVQGEEIDFTGMTRKSGGADNTLYTSWLIIESLLTIIL